MTNLHLDVDGVINADYPQWDQPRSEGHAYSNGQAWVIHWSPAMVEALSALDLNLIWTTTWEADAPRSIGPLIGYGESGSVLYPIQGTTYRRFRDASMVWKYEAMRAMYPEDSAQRFVWLDDEITNEQIEWAASVGGLAISIDPDRGIQRSDIEKIKEYLDAE